MRRFQCQATALCLVLSLASVIMGCGSSSGSSGGSSSSENGTSPQSSEFLYAKGFVDTLAFKVDTGSGKITLIQTVTGTSTTFTFASGSAMAAPKSANYLYMVNPEDTGINAYSIAANGTLALVSGSPFSLPADMQGFPYINAIAVSPTGNAVYAVDTGWESVAAFQINAGSGSLTALSTSFPTGGQPQQAIVDPSGKSLYVTDSQDSHLDQNFYAGISGYSVDSSSASITPLTKSPYTMGSNTQPSGIVIDPTGRFVYAALSNSNAIAGFTRDSASGELAQMSQSPFKTEPIQFTQTYYVAMHPSGKFLYAFNLAGHTISVFSIDQTNGFLTQIPGSPFPPQEVPDDPNHTPTTQGPMAVDPSGQYLYVLCTNPLIAAYKINLTTGALTVASGSPYKVSENVVALTLVQKP